MKKYLQSVIPNFNEIRLIENPIEHWIGDQRADVYSELKNNNKIAFECQYSPIKYEDLMKRTKGYIDKGIFPFWLLDAKGSCVSKYKERDYENPVINYIRTSETERNIFKLFGRIYYIDVPDREFNIKDKNDDIKVYCAIFRNCYDKFGDKLHYSTIKNIYLKPIKELKLECIKNDKISFARFYTKKFNLKKIKTFELKQIALMRKTVSYYTSFKKTCDICNSETKYIYSLHAEPMFGWKSLFLCDICYEKEKEERSKKRPLIIAILKERKFQKIKTKVKPQNDNLNKEYNPSMLDKYLKRGQNNE